MWATITSWRKDGYCQSESPLYFFSRLCCSVSTPARSISRAICRNKFDAYTHTPSFPKQTAIPPLLAKNRAHPWRILSMVPPLFHFHQFPPNQSTVVCLVASIPWRLSQIRNKHREGHVIRDLFVSLPNDTSPFYKHTLFYCDLPSNELVFCPEGMRFCVALLWFIWHLWIGLCIIQWCLDANGNCTG